MRRRKWPIQAHWGNKTTYIWEDKQDNKEKENFKPGPPLSLVLATYTPFLSRTVYSTPPPPESPNPDTLL